MEIKVRATKYLEVSDAEWKSIEDQGIMNYFYGNATEIFSSNTKWEITTLPMIVQDDEHCFGKPRIEGTGIPVEMIVDRFTAGDSIDTLTDDYNISQIQVEEAIRYHLDNRNKRNLNPEGEINEE